MADDEPRRYQTRARSKVTEDDISTTKSVPLKPPGAVPRVLRNTTAVAKSVEVTLKVKSSGSSTTVAAGAAVRPTRKAAAGVVATRREAPEKANKATGIPGPSRTTRSGRVAAAAAANPPTTTTTGAPENATGDKEQKAPSRRGTGSAGGRGGKKKAFNDDKENQGPASEMGAELKQQEIDAAGAAASAESQPTNPLTTQPVRKAASGSISSPNKNAIRPIASLKPKESESLLHSPPKRTHQPPINGGGDSADELECPVSVGLQSQARRPNNPLRLQAPEPVSYLASPPRRTASQQPGTDRKLPAMVLTFDQPAMLMKSPAKRGSALNQSPSRIGAAPGKQLAMPPQMDLLGSPPKRPVKKPLNEADVEKEVDELSLDTYRIENSPRRPGLKKGLQYVSSVKQSKREASEEDPFVSKKIVSQPASAKTDAEGDVEMTDIDTDMEDCFASPCPASESQSQGFGLFSEDDDWDSLSPTGEPGVNPLVSGLEDLNMGLEGSRKSLFPKRKGQDRSVALEDSAHLEIADMDAGENEENIPNAMTGGIPIDPMLLEEDLTEGRGPVKVRSARSNILTGAVVYVDVHAAQGGSMSAKVVEKLQSLGAKVVEQWSWKPANGTGKIGITHVVFRGGRPRTLQKVKESRELVVCVGIEWVVECEKEQKWVDEGMFELPVVDSEESMTAGYDEVILHSHI